MKYQFLPLFLKKTYLFYLAASGLSCSMQHLLLQKCTGFRSLWFSCGTLRAYLLQGMREVSFPTRDGTLDSCTEFLTTGPPGKSPNFCVCVCVCVLVTQSCPTLQPHGPQPTRPLCPWDSPGKNTGGGSLSLLQRIFLTQGSNPGLLQFWQILYHLSHQGSPISAYLIAKI